MSARALLIAPLLISISTLACSGDAGTTSDDPAVDTGAIVVDDTTPTPIDSSTPDTTKEDAGTPSDTETPTDTSIPSDTTTPVDTSTPLDTATPLDASTPLDTAKPDVAADTAPPACGASLVPAWAASATFTRDLHVKIGAAAGGDGSSAKPYASLATGLGAAKAGDRVIVHAGTYPGDLYATLAGTAAKPIMITGAAGEAIPRISGGSEGLHLTDATYVIVQDLEVSGQTSNAMNVDDGGTYATPSHHVLFQRLNLHDVATGNHDGLKMSGVDDAVILESRFAKIGGQMIDMVGCHRVTVALSRFEDGESVGVQMKGGSSDDVVTRNVFTNAGPRAVNMGGSTDLPFFRPIDAPHEAARIMVSANVFVGSDAPIAFVGCDACTAAQNTIVRPVRWVARILQETTDARFVKCRNGKMLNNVIVVGAGISGETINVGTGTLPATFTFSNNLWFNTTSATWKPTLPTGVTETGGIYGLDPKLVDVTKPDAHLQATSPAIAKGGDLAKTVPADHDGACWKVPPSIGAFER